jgi:hypothetical protein
MEPQAEGNQFTLQTIRDLREVEGLREVWKSWQETRDSDLDLFSGVVRSRGDSCRPHVIVLTRNARPEALLVGLRDRTKIPFRLCSVTMRQPKVNVLEFVRRGLLGNASIENCIALVQAVMRSLAEGDAIPNMEQIASKSVKRWLGFVFGFFDTPRAREQLLVEAAKGWLRICILYFEENPVAFWKGTLMSVACKQIMWATIPLGAPSLPESFFSSTF